MSILNSYLAFNSFQKLQPKRKLALAVSVNSWFTALYQAVQSRDKWIILFFENFISLQNVSNLC